MQNSRKSSRTSIHRKMATNCCISLIRMALFRPPCGNAVYVSSRIRRKQLAKTIVHLGEKNQTETSPVLSNRDKSHTGYNGSQFMITFDETPSLDGYQNNVGELVEGDQVLASMEQDSLRSRTGWWHHKNC